MLVGASLRYSQASFERMQDTKVLFINISGAKALMSYIQTSLFYVKVVAVYFNEYLCVAKLT